MVLPFLIGFAAFAGLIFYLITGSIVAIGIGKILSPTSSLFWIAIGAFTLFFLFWRRR